MHAGRGPRFPELVASLPIAGRDGTLTKTYSQSPFSGRSHIKTGSLNGVSAIAGYVLTDSGRRLAVVALLEHPLAAKGPGRGSARPAFDIAHPPLIESAPGKSLPRQAARKASMKLVMAIIKPFRLDHVRNTLSDLGINGMTVSEVQGFGRQRGHTELYRGAEYMVDFIPKTKIEVACTDELAERVVEAIMDSGKTGKVGDGKVFVMDLEEAYRVRTGESGDSAL